MASGPGSPSAPPAIGVETLGDLLANVPHRHEDRSEQTLISDLPLGAEKTIAVVIRSAKVRPTRRRNLSIVEAKVADESGVAKAVWFNQAWLADRLRAGHELAPAREARPQRVPGRRLRGAGGGGHPHDGDRPDPLGERGPRAEEAPRLDPAGARARRRRDRAAAGRDPRPPQARRASPTRSPPPTSPKTLEQVRARAPSGSPSRSSSCTRRRSPSAAAAARTSAPASRSTPSGELVADWLDSLPFEPTGDQRRAMEEIDADLASGRPMQRLLMGEVG